MPELTAPDELFDADLVTVDEHSLADRSDWIIQDGQIIHAPVVGQRRRIPLSARESEHAEHVQRSARTAP
ncbi:hypothetical protein AB0465_14020 [Streptomyces griseoviridis]|uniref:hypothetical protein n=1 Tax=Streptomyces griseoviridis TaxID=45398 RepID=UPI0033CDE73D